MTAGAIEGVRAAPRWQLVTITARALTRPTESVRVLAYRAMAQRAGDPPYQALCSSTHVDRGEGWRLVSHQQTPL